jgi:hypothetical protein
MVRYRLNVQLRRVASYHPLLGAGGYVHAIVAGTPADYDTESRTGGQHRSNIRVTGSDDGVRVAQVRNQRFRW